MEIQGRIEAIMDTQVISDKFQKREFVITTEADVNGRTFTNYHKLELTQDNCDKIDSYNVGSMVSVAFNLKGNKWEKDGKVNYFNSLQAWKISAVGGEAVSSGTPVAQESTVMDDDLPF